MNTANTKTEIARHITAQAAAQAATAAARAAVQAAHARLKTLKHPSPAERATLQALEDLEAAAAAQADLDGIKKAMAPKWAAALGPGQKVICEWGTFTASERTAWKGAAAEALADWDEVAAHKLISRHTKISHRLTMAPSKAAQARYLAHLAP